MQSYEQGQEKMCLLIFWSGQFLKLDSKPPEVRDRECAILVCSATLALGNRPSFPLSLQPGRCDSTFYMALGNFKKYLTGVRYLHIVHFNGAKTTTATTVQ